MEPGSQRDLEELTDEELVAIRERYLELAHRARADLRKGLKDTGAVDLADQRRRS